MADKYITIAGTSYRYKKTDSGGGGGGGDTPTPGANWVYVDGGNIPGGNYFLRSEPALDLAAIGGAGNGKFTIIFDSHIGGDPNAEGTPYLGRTYYINNLPAYSDTPFTRDTVDHLRWSEEISPTLMWIGANPIEDDYNPLG